MMNQNKTLMLTLVISGAFFVAGACPAGVEDAKGKWIGMGTVFDIHGEAQGNYRVEMENTIVSAGVLKSEATIRVADGKQIKIAQTITDRARGFAIVSSVGNGGGYCFGADLCEAYVSDGPRAYASTF